MFFFANSAGTTERTELKICTHNGTNPYGALIKFCWPLTSFLRSMVHFCAERRRLSLLVKFVLLRVFFTCGGSPNEFGDPSFMALLASLNSLAILSSALPPGPGVAGVPSALNGNPVGGPESPVGTRWKIMQSHKRNYSFPELKKICFSLLQDMKIWKLDGADFFVKLTEKKSCKRAAMGRNSCNFHSWV